MKSHRRLAAQGDDGDGCLFHQPSSRQERGAFRLDDTAPSTSVCNASDLVLGDHEFVFLLYGTQATPGGPIISSCVAQARVTFKKLEI